MANCGNSSIDKVPLVDSEFGLFGQGADVMPDDHFQAGMAAGGRVQQLNRFGEPDPAGKIGLVAFGGMSNANQEWGEFIRVAKVAIGTKRVRFANLNRGGWDARRMVESGDEYWAWVSGQFAKPGSQLTAAQVQVAWLKNSVAKQELLYPAGPQMLRGYLEQILARGKAFFPNLQQVFVSSAIFSGYSTKPTRCEPFAYEEGFGVQSLILASLGQSDPWVSWGPYLWADGVSPREDGLVWVCSDFEDDGVHPGPQAEAKVAAMLLDFFNSKLFTIGWFHA